jgi:hypothetical protein
MKKIYFLLTFIVFTTTVMAQTKGISYQAVLYDPAYKNQTLPGVDNTLIPYANKPVCLRFQITDKNNQAVYIETQSTKTDPFGMVNLIIGQGTKIGGLVSSFETINWNAQANGLIVSLDNSGNCSDFKEVTNQPFTASPFSLGTTSINTADFELIANKSNNITVDANSTTKYPSVNAIKSYVDSKVVTIPDADATTKGKIQLAGDLGGTASLPTVPGLALKVDKEVGKGLSTNDFTTIEKTKLAAITGSNTGDQDLSSYATIASIGSKQEVSNISNTIQTDANSTTKYPSVKGIKDYVDGLNSAGGVSDNSITSVKIADNAIVNIDVSPSAAIDFSKLNISKSNILGLGIVKSDIGLSNVDNTTDLAKPISTATQTALDLKANTADVSSLLALKANLASPTFTGTVSGIDKTMVGLGNVDNTTDLAKPISTATQTALNLKANTTDVSTSLGLKEDAANKSTTTTLGTSDVLFPTQNAVKTYVDGNMTSITNAISTEATTARAAEATLTTNLAAEATTARAAESAISTAISTEATTARAAEATLTTNLTAEVNTARAAELANATAISTEATTARAAEATLTTILASEATTARAAESANATAIITEATRATGAETALAADIATNANAITAEATRATGAEATLTTNIATNTTAIADETARATAVETTLTTNLAAEVTRATDAEGTLTTNVTANANAIASEKTRATAAEATLTTNLATEASTARAAELANAAAIALKENSSNKTLDIVTDGSSDEKFPSAKAAKTYADAKVVDGITDAVTTSAPTQNAVFDALALKASKVEITSTEIALPTKINAKQMYSISGDLSVTAGTTSATIPAVTGLTDYYSIRIFKDGKPFRNEVRSFTNGTPIAIITGNGMMSEIYPSGIYTYVLEYFK